MTILPTIGVISKQLGVPAHRVEYVIVSRGIKPVGRAGNARVFSASAVGLIKDELAKIDSERGVAS